DGIRDGHVTGVQTCALPICGGITYVSVSDIFFDDSESASTVVGSFVIGFRKQPFGKKGLTWRIAFTPFLGFGGFQPWAGASVGLDRKSVVEGNRVGVEWAGP